MARGSNGDSSPGKSRWRPTPEQLMVLQELFIRRGVKTPTAQQIQRITQQLTQFGKVETKNVFYWFQNHKAREKQKLRKRLLNCYYYFQHQSHHGQVNGESEATGGQQQPPPKVHYFLPPQQLSHVSGFWPFIPAPAQVTRECSNNDEALVKIVAPATSSGNWSGGNCTDEKPCDSDHYQYIYHGDDGLSSREERAITWTNYVVIDSINSSRPPLKTLQLFPTSTIATVS